MRKERKPCFFCKGFKLRKIDFLLIIVICVIMYWVNQYQVAQIDKEQREEAKKAQQIQKGD